MGEYYTDDITWCSNRRCNSKRCERNPKRIRPNPIKEYSFADLENTAYCIKANSQSQKEEQNGRMD